LYINFSDDEPIQSFDLQLPEARQNALAAILTQIVVPDHTVRLWLPRIPEVA
jgi:hypothetical protein